MKRFLSFLLAIVIIAISSPLCFAAVYENFSYEVNADNTITITGYSNLHLNSVTVPDTIDGKTVTRIGDNVFKGKSSLKTVKIPNTVVSIGNYAFYSCKNLTSVTLGNGVKALGNYCFNLCQSLTSIHLNNVETIGEFAFYGCEKLTTLNCGNSLTAIPKRAFSDCELLSNITFPKLTLKSIDDYAFANCLSIVNLTFPNSLNFIGLSAFSNNAVLESVTFGRGALEISGYAFENCPLLLSVTLPESVTSVGRYAFALRDETEFSHSQGFNFSCYSTCPSAVIYSSEAGIDPYLIDLKQTVKFGDVNNDKKVTTEDARIVLRAHARLGELDESRMFYIDVNLDGVYDSTDARIILRKAIMQEVQASA
ncbi:MAG: leucine-rich repeat protein [Clostridia bacterium]|nr:leucine-rich repeat protein [Clostridia bacterium]